MACGGGNCGGCGTGAGAKDFTSGMEMIYPSLVSFDRGVGSGRKLRFTLAKILSRHSSMDGRLEEQLHNHSTVRI